ncbi:MAG TPA: phenylalanine--tRNA ligase subunit beta [Candidatus Dormibacteraeota bacterium]|jgi:phenylalanyl-tRNA synthetase beta chain|nr:phenylalanine--tRNA ligase subunit beta [Candidatus Dormibacteraeota bacterium]
MRFSYEWLCDLAGVKDVAPEKGAEVLTMAGFVVDHVSVIDYAGIVVGRIESQVPHPRSRKPLWIHQVDLGTETRQIIAGAPNAVPGTLVPVALPGTTVPGGVTVRDGVIAGEAARGMLCSAAELLIEDGPEGILLLEAGEPGQPLSAVIPNEAILDVEVTANRPDCLGHLGLARELAAGLGRSLGRDFMPRFTGGVEPKGTDLIQVDIEAPDLCRRYIGAVLSNVHVGPSPSWMQRRLRSGGIRPINNVVDVTNYVCLEYGQPLHAFDLDQVRGARIIVRRAEEGERLMLLDGVERSLNPSMLVIADGEGPVALAGLMGGEESGVTGLTTRILLESANFDGVNVRATSRALRVRTDASARFEKGLSPELALAGARRAAMLLAELAGATVHTEWVDEYPRPQDPVRISFPPERIDAILGITVPREEMEAGLTRLEFQVQTDGDGEWDVFPPVYRLDVRIAEDVAEEVGRSYGYDNVPATLPAGRRGRWLPFRPSQERTLDAARNSLAGAGYDEIVSVALVSSRVLEGLGIADRTIRVVNPVSDEHDVMRTSLAVTLLQAAALNRQRDRAALSAFEMGRVYLGRDDGPEGQPDEIQRLAMLRLAGPEPDEGRAAFLQVKGAFERAAEVLRLHDISYEPATGVLFHPGRCARVLVDGRPAGHLGELHPQVMERFDLPGRAVLLEVDVEPLLTGGRDRRYAPLARFPTVDRDLAVVVGGDLPAASLLSTIRDSGGELLKGARAFDEYIGPQVGEGRKSVAFSLTFRSPERTLTDAEVDGELARVRKALTGAHGAEFRA